MDMKEMNEIVPTLVLDDEENTVTGISTADVVSSIEKEEAFDKEKFSEAELKQIDEFSEQIDLRNMNLVMRYGSTAQKKSVAFSDAALSSVRTKEFGEIGDLLVQITTEIRGFGETEKKGLFGLFQKGRNKIEGLRAKYATSEQNINKVAKALESHQFTLLKDISLMENLFAQNKAYYKELSMYIAAGKKKLQEVKNGELVDLQRKAQETQDPEYIQDARDLAAMCERFGRKIHDLEVTRTVTLQSAPQIRLVQEDDAMMAEKIQATLTNAIPLWKNQMVLALGVAHAEQAATAQKAVTDTINEVMKKNADTLKQATIATAQENERELVDLETLEHTNQQLMATIDEVIAIQEAGQERRKNVEVELTRIEGELKAKLLEASGRTV